MNIALIDSGIDENNPLINSKTIIKGWKNGYESFHDFIGHGTTCAQIIQKIVPCATLVNVKVFNNKLVTSPRNIIEAINWCVNNNIQIVNLSISVNEINYYYEFKEICDEAERKEVIIVASGDNLGRACLPAYLGNVIGVSTAFITNDLCYVFKERNSIQCYTNGKMIKDSEGPNLLNSQATSFATARMTGIIAAIMQSNENHEYKNLLSLLIANSINEDNIEIPIRNEEFDFGINTVKISLGNSIKPLLENLKKFAFIGDPLDISVLKTFSNESIVNSTDLIEMETETTFDKQKIEGRMKDFGKYNMPSSEKNLFNKYDSILVSKLPLGLYQLILREAVNESKNALFLHPIGKDLMNSIKLNLAVNDSQIIFSPNEEIENLAKSAKNISENHISNNQLPILCICDITNSRNNSLILQLILRRELFGTLGKVGQISTNPLSQLFGFDYTLFQSNQSELKLQPVFAKMAIESINNCLPESSLIVIGLDGPILPVNLISANYFDTYTLPGISLLLGIQPDAFVVAINELTDIRYLLRTIDAIESLLDVKKFFIAFLSLYNLGNAENNIEIIQKYFNYEEIMRTSRERLSLLKSETMKQSGLMVYDIQDKLQLSTLAESFKGAII